MIRSNNYYHQGAAITLNHATVVHRGKKILHTVKERWQQLKCLPVLLKLNLLISSCSLSRLAAAFRYWFCSTSISCVRLLTWVCSSSRSSFSLSRPLVISKIRLVYFVSHWLTEPVSATIQNRCLALSICECICGMFDWAGAGRLALTVGH